MSLLAALVLPRQAHAQEEIRQEFLRVTFYTLPGRMASGAMVHEGAAACSAWMPFGTVLELPDGRQVTCLDRGLGDRYWRGWIDIWVPSYRAGLVNVEATYGTYSWVNVRRWGWE